MDEWIVVDTPALGVGFLIGLLTAVAFDLLLTPSTTRCGWWPTHCRFGKWEDAKRQLDVWNRDHPEDKHPIETYRIEERRCRGCGKLEQRRVRL